MSEGRVSDSDRRALRRQAQALAAAEHHDEGDAPFGDSVARWANTQRAAAGQPPLLPWWSDKTEPEFHERARALGLLD